METGYSEVIKVTIEYAKYIYDTDSILRGLLYRERLLSRR